MGFFENFKGLWQPKAQTPGPLDDFWYDGYPYAVNAGVRINPTTAMRITAVYACVRLLSENGAAVPCQLFRHIENGGKELAVDHPLYDVLMHAPNHYQTPFEFKQQLIRCASIRGFFYAEIVLDRSGYPQALLPLHPDRVTIEKLPGKRWRYRYIDEDGLERIFMPEELFRVVEYTEEDGFTPISPIKANADTVGVTEAAERYAASYFGNASNPGGALESDLQIDDPTRKSIRESWERAHRGPNNSGKVAVLGSGLKYKPISINPEDAQLLDTREFQLTDICRIFGVPPHLVQQLLRATFSNIEHQSLDFSTYTMRPKFRRIEDSIGRDLLLADERKTYFAKFDLNDLMAADLKAQAEYSASGIQNGWMTPNEVRKRQGLNALDGLDEPMIPNNLRKLSDPPPTAATPGFDKGQQSTNKGNSDK
jgi:HK97 family phage portal protein